MPLVKLGVIPDLLELADQLDQVRAATLHRLSIDLEAQPVVCDHVYRITMAQYNDVADLRSVVVRCDLCRHTTRATT